MLKIKGICYISLLFLTLKNFYKYETEIEFLLIVKLKLSKTIRLRKYKMFKKQSWSWYIVDKSETCLVESNNSNIRSNIARFNRRTKAFSRDITSIEDAMYLYVYKNKIQNNIVRYANLGRVV